MGAQVKVSAAKEHKADLSPSLELYLSRDTFSTGKRLSGVVVLRLARPINIRSLLVSVTGVERPAGASLARTFRKYSPFFTREQLFSGALEPRLASERASLIWNAILGRYTGRTLCAGEHTYPFSIPLPASLPPSYDGRAGKIQYRVTARLQPTIGRATKASKTVRIMFIPRLRGRPVALGYPAADGTVQSTDINVTIDLDERMVSMGEVVSGRFSITNPNAMAIPKITASLEVCEWVRLAVEKEIQRDRVDIAIIVPEEPSATFIQAPFRLRLPKTAPPTIEGSVVSVIWLLKITLQTEPTIEFKTPVTVYLPVEGSGA